MPIVTDIYVIMNISVKLKSPYQWFGGKAKVADVIWRGLGKIDNYIEPFCGSLAVLLANKNIPKIETVNDINAGLTNFWRAVSGNPEEVAKYATYPINQIDLHARHRWLIKELNEEFVGKLDADPHFYDAKIAGWWIWGIGASIGNNFLQDKGLKALPCLSFAGGGIHGLSKDILSWFKELQNRTKRTRICCTDWKKILTPSITYNNNGLGKNEITGVFLDPPYSHSNRDKVYLNDEDIYTEVCNWAVENANQSNLRIVVCGYEGDFDFPSDWQTYSWKTQGGMSNMGNDNGRQNSFKERIYFSPQCLKI